MERSKEFVFSTRGIISTFFSFCQKSKHKPPLDFFKTMMVHERIFLEENVIKVTKRTVKKGKRDGNPVNRMSFDYVCRCVAVI